jgi:hypothetical protein
MSIINTVNEVLSKRDEYDKWDSEQDNIELKRAKYLQSKQFTPEELEKIKLTGQRLVDTITIMDEKSEDVAEDIEEGTQQITQQFVSAVSMVSTMLGFGLNGKKTMEMLSKGNLKDYYKLTTKLALFSSIPTIIAFGLASIYSSKLQLAGSTVGRKEARDSMDVKDFIEYTPEQMKEAEKIAETLPDKKDKKKLFQGINNLNPFAYWGTLMQVLKEKQNASTDSDKTKNIKLENLSSQEKKDIHIQQNLLNRIIKKINNKAEDYSENMETTAGVLLGSSFLIGGLVGKFASFVAKKIGKKLPLPGQAITLLSSLLAGLLTAPVTLSLQKNAARAGRFRAKQELMQDPTNFIYVDNKDIKSVQDTKIEKPGLFKRIFKVIQVLPQTINDLFEYEKYKKTELPKIKKLNEALKQVDISEEQLKKGELHKQLTFKSFEKIDSNSQKYSEEVEATCEIAQQTGTNAWSLVATLPFLYGLYRTPNVINKVTGFIAKHTDAGWFKKYLDKIPARAGEIISAYKPKGDLADLIKKHKDTAVKLLNNQDVSDEAVKAIIKDMNDSKIFGNMGFNLESLNAKTIKPYVEGLINNFMSTANITKQLKEGLFKYVGDLKSEIELLPDNKAVQEFVQENNILKNIFDGNISKEKVLEVFNNIQKIENNIPAEEFNKIGAAIIEKIKTEPEKAIPLLMNNPKKLLQAVIPQNKLYAVGGTYIGLNILGMYMLNAYLADIQKTAGRIGTMEGIKELEKEEDILETVVSSDQTSIGQETNSNLNDNKRLQIKNKISMQDFLKIINKKHQLSS